MQIRKNSSCNLLFIIMNGISTEEAFKLIEGEDKIQLLELLVRASKKREQYSGNKVTACSIINARCGGCAEDCAFCAQSKNSTAKIDYYALVSEDKIIKAAEKAVKDGAHHFGIVTSGRAVNGSKDLEVICRAVEHISKKLSISPCASLGTLDRKSLRRLRDSGLVRYHHNLETSESFFPTVCTTRSYKAQIEAVKDARDAGLSLCSGGIFGLGESRGQRIELLDTIRSLNVDSIPLNFLVPIPGTRMENMKDLTPFECLKIIAVARLMMPDKTIRVCGGREHNLRDFQSWIFSAGADGLMIGGYLVTSGREVHADLQMIKDAGMVLET